MRVLLVFALIALQGCSTILKEKEQTHPGIEQAITKPLTPEETDELIDKVGDDFVYGPGLGKTALNVGAVVMFPPYAIYLVGNALLEVGGYEPIEISDALGKEGSANWDSAYETVISGPGRVTAAVAGREYKDQELIKDETQVFLEKVKRRQEAETAISRVGYSPGGEARGEIGPRINPASRAAQSAM